VATHTIRRGLDLPLAGEPLQAVEDARPVGSVALVAADYHGLRPHFVVQAGDTVRRGQPLFDDKSSGVVHTAPAAGRVAAINRGERRAFQSLVIELDAAEQAGRGEQMAFASYTGRPIDHLSHDEVRALLVESGLWTALRTRPYSKVPPPDAVPHALFITAIDTHPHAPDVSVVLAGREKDFHAGLACLAKLTEGKTYLCAPPALAHRIEPVFGVEVEFFEGPHPAGTAGLHIHLLDPVSAGKTVWHIGYQDTIALGHLALTGVLDTTRVVSLAGPAVRQPRLLRTRLGASLADLARDELADGELRVVSGSVLGGRTATGPVLGYLGRYHQQVAALREGSTREFLGWATPGADKFSVVGVVLGAFLKGRQFGLTTNTMGSPRAMVPIGTYEKLMPFDILPTFLLRALLTRDIERAVALGALELDEEDLALCTFACPGKNDYGPLLRSLLAEIEKEGA